MVEEKFSETVHLEIIKMASYIFYVFCYNFLEITIGHQQSGELGNSKLLFPYREKKKKKKKPYTAAL